MIEGITIPKGTKVYWSMLGAGRDAETYPQPEQFLPQLPLRFQSREVVPSLLK
ncbi:hypothetical protein PL8927_550060 [Planktothrix serta PCC 8927]|uniref:Uncharacterized protein n=1 Tax=Planktothrix serta PCC 8927 TaxID=671068 RepID=A0A7Z9E0I9_9CYAN|nr:hypothetical protein PL8927_550060 [Planktothrix serta PCC 8927]